MVASLGVEIARRRTTGRRRREKRRTGGGECGLRLAERGGPRTMAQCQ